MPDHMPPSFAPDSPPDLDSRDVRQPIDPDAALHEQIETARAIKAVAHDAGYRLGYEAGRRAAQTEIDGLTYERGVTDEQARCAKLADSLLPAAAGAVLVRAIRSGEPAPSGT